MIKANGSLDGLGKLDRLLEKLGKLGRNSNLKEKRRIIWVPQNYFLDHECSSSSNLQDSGVYFYLYVRDVSL